MRRLTGSFLLAWCAAAAALAPGDRVENFRLLDHEGGSQQLHYFSDARAVVIMVHGNGCPIVRNALPALREIRDAYAAKGVEFLLINSNLQDDRGAIVAEAKAFGVDMPIMLDTAQIIGESLGIVRTGEVFVIDPASWKLVYRGALDDRLTYERQRAEATAHYLTDALDALLAGQAPAVATTDPVGCLVNFPERGRREAHAAISYSETIAPMLVENCVTCHRPGGIGPWAMTEYRMVQGFAPMIREVVRTGRMPPWHADPHFGAYANDRSLDAEQVRLLVHWIEAGAPRGDGPDPLLAVVHERPEWALGEPDLVIEIPPYEIPASGVVEYQYPMVRNPLDRDVWVRATEILPGTREGLHHVITTFGLPDPNRRGGLAREGSLGGYVPGAEAELLPDDTGVLLPAGAVLRFQMHYTPFGRPVTDRSRLGIYFHDAPPRHELHTTILMNPRIRIPPRAKAHSESAARVFDQDVLVYNLLPHAHYRGKASEFRAVLPDGSERVLLSVPNYDFNWQTTYELTEPVRLPAGTRIVHTTTWDNSAQNPANPDPDREVPWGEQSWDEMLFGAVRWRALSAEELAAEADSTRPGLPAASVAGRVEQRERTE
ncbi:MAG: redoxin family protein [Pseudomonadales bacterium]|nr:redoxin family protein [Pseudomonadales bacterium]